MMRYRLCHRRRHILSRGYRWFWRLIDGNGELVSQGRTRGYSRRIDAERAIAQDQSTNDRAPIEEER